MSYIKILFYVDDVLQYISNTSRSIPELDRTIKEYGSILGYKINDVKTEDTMLSSRKQTILVLWIYLKRIKGD